MEEAEPQVMNFRPRSELVKQLLHQISSVMFHLSLAKNVKRILFGLRYSFIVLLLTTLPVGKDLVAQEIPRVNNFHEISVGEALEKTISGNEIHSYRLSLNKNEFANLKLNTFPESLGIEIFDSGGKQIQQEWRLPGDDTPFELEFFAEEKGVFEIRISLGIKEAPGEKYHLQVKPVSTAEVKKKLKDLEEVRNWIRGTAVPLQSVELVDETTDLLELKEVLNEVQVLGLGEATHGSREFFRIKHRLLEFLVKEMEFTHFAIEGSQSAARAVNQYVLSGEGNSAEVLKNMGFWQWDTPEVADLIEWMYSYNQNVPEDGKIKFIGFDFQVNSPAARELIFFMENVAPETAAAIQADLEPLWKNVDDRPSFVEYYTFTKEKKDSIIQKLEGLKNLMEENRTSFIQKSSEKNYLAALQNLKLLNQFAVTYNTPGYDIKDPNSGTAMRDRIMAEHILEILESEGGEVKILVWSHNEHVKKDPYNMGYYLSQALGKAYYAVGMGFDHGSFQAIELTDNGVGPVKEMSVGPAFQNSVEWFLKPLEIPGLFLDLRKAPRSGSVNHWLRTPLDMRSIGNGFYNLNPGGYFRPPVKLIEAYDGLIYIEQVSRAISYNPYRVKKEEDKK